MRRIISLGTVAVLMALVIVALSAPASAQEDDSVLRPDFWCLPEDELCQGLRGDQFGDFPEFGVDAVGAQNKEIPVEERGFIVGLPSR
jgi:hypothetical protein